MKWGLNGCGRRAAKRYRHVNLSADVDRDSQYGERPEDAVEVEVVYCRDKGKRGRGAPRERGARGTCYKVVEISCSGSSGSLLCE